MEFYALANLEEIFLAVLRDAPALGEAGRNGAGAIDAAETLENAGRRHLADGGGGVLGRIEQRRLERHADHESILGRSPRLGAESGHRHERAGGAEQMATRK
jgi:hypothetical protein